MQNHKEVWNGKEVDDKPTFATKKDGPKSIEQYIDYNFKFWEVCERGGHDFIERIGDAPQCAVCGTPYSERYKEAFTEHGGKHHLYGGEGWSQPSVIRSRKALERIRGAPIGQSTVTPAGQSSEIVNTEFIAWCRKEEGPSIALVDSLKLLWLFSVFFRISIDGGN